MIAQRVIAGFLEQGLAGTLTWQGDLDELGDARPRAVTHQHDSVSEQNGFIDVVRNHEDGLPRRLHDAQQLVLDGASRKRVQRAKGFVQQEHLGLNRKGARDADPLLHSSRKR